MNVKQLVVFCIVVVAIVFAITVVTWYVGGGDGKPIDPIPIPVGVHLFFPKTELEAKPEGPPIYEIQVPGHHDFWFENQTGGPVQLGLRGKSCKCSKVEVCILTEDQWKTASPDNLERLGKEGTWQTLAEYREDRKGITVPPGGAGWARLEWKSEVAKLENLTADLWTQASGEMGTVSLKAPLLIVEAVYCIEEGNAHNPTQSPGRQDEKIVGKLGLGDKGQARFLCWSATRPHFKVTPEPSKTPCIVIDEPVKLDDKQCKKWSEKLGLPVLCAYSVAVNVTEQADDKHQLDLGLFRFRIGLTTDAGVNPNVYVLGEVEGPVSVQGVGDDRRSRIDLGQFSNAEDKVVDVRLFTSDRNLELKIDRKRTETPFFQVKDPEEKPQGSGKLWNVEVTIPAGTVAGPFPDRDKYPKPGHEDCAVYLLVRKKPEAGAPEETWRRIRVPIIGNATR